MLLNEIYKRLELTDDCLIKLSDPDWKSKVSFPSRIYRLLETNDLLKDMDAFFCFDNKPLILFFSIDGSNENQKKALHQAIWNFNESPIAIIVSNNTVEIFNGFAIDEKTNLLRNLGTESELDNFKYFKLVTGQTWETYNDEISHKNRVDYKLLKNIEATQKRLIGLGITQKIANALIGKIIFIRYLIDRKVQLHFENKQRLWTNEDLCELLQKKDRFIQFISYLEHPETGFNGDLFPISNDEFNLIPQEALDVIILLLNGVEIETGQLSLFKLYDFSILPVEFISNVYEKFIGKENQDKEGAYYTPTFLVDYIIQQTVGEHLENSNTIECKVLDPACGSGIFLVESLRRIIDKYIKENQISLEDRSKKSFHTILRKLVTNNIYGIDKDDSAVQVAIFSIYLTLLDYQNPADIGKFKFPKLLGTNLICSDAFQVSNTALNKLEKKIQNGELLFDYIIGNPPWMRGRIVRDENGNIITPTYIQYLKETKQSDIIGNKELAQAFVLRSLDFTAKDTKVAFVLTSKTLYNLQSQRFRRHILSTLCITQVFELAAVRREVFNQSNDKATTPACVIFYQKANGNEAIENNIEHIALKPSRFFSMFKVFSLTRTDIQYVKQKFLYENDWLWKVLVYGSYLDYNFIKRLKSYKSIKSFLDENEATCRQGLKRKDGNNHIDTSKLIGWNFLDLSKEIYQYGIEPIHQKWSLSSVGYIPRSASQEIDTDIFEPPMLLVKETVNTHLESISAISLQQLLFTDKITSIKIPRNNNISLYRNIAGLINSSLFAYYILMSSSTVGIMIEQQVNDEERFGFPYLYSQKVVNIIEEIETQYNQASKKLLRSDVDISDAKDRINLHISKLFNLNHVEKDLLDYAITIAIPTIMRHRIAPVLYKPIDINDSEHILKNYIKVYQQRFAEVFQKEGMHFSPRILYTPLYIGMIFEIKSSQNILKKSPLIEDATNKTDLWNRIIALSANQVTNRLFVQKDIRGFTSDSFYIFKPNEKRLWHRAIAYVDVNEFAEAMLKAGEETR